MWLDWIALTAVFVFGALGAWRGTLASFLRIFGLAVGYAAALFSAPRFGSSMAQLAHVPPFVGTALAGAAGFAGTFIVLAPVSWLLRRRADKRRGEDPRSLLDRLGGAFFGLLQGALVALLIGVVGNWIEASRGFEAPSAQQPAAQASLVARATTSLIEGAADLALAPDNHGARLAVRLAARPAETLESVRALMERPEVAALRDDDLFWSYVANGAVEQALNRGSLLKISSDPKVRAEFASLGLVGADSAADATAFRAELRPVIAEVGPRIKALKESGELQRLLEDPEILRAVQAGDSVSLFSHPAFRSMIYRALESPPPSAPTSEP